ncbi:beta-1,3-galactosyltransferase 1-like [Mizuhopecten yessoensis]|uniref:Hexosyltransferase n=1 Tax=Mizuhopecten yessoensis TaxID=6573 RepID=A0A210Q2R7_MIZYE|nr:beta-1,3-galactosyltransferase 1-like [Mizuhopecten yessoensis]OWF43012.1 Beta-1,3-galactosyltransferase 1 [Mizuhopecten yessoensis]
MDGKTNYKTIVVLVFCLSCMLNLLAYLLMYNASRERTLQDHSKFLLSSGGGGGGNIQPSSLSENRLTNSFAPLAAAPEGTVRIGVQQFLKARLKSPEVLSRKLQEEDNSNVDQDNQNATVGNVTNPHNYTYVINQPDICRGDNPLDLIIVVCTSVAGFSKRQTIRETWGLFAKEQKNVKNLFFLGVQDEENIQKKVLEESEIHHDIVQEDFRDSYRNLSIKSVGALKWMTDYCHIAKFGLKIDDDIFVNIPNLMETLSKVTHPRIIIGHLFVGARPIQNRNSKWHTAKEDFPRDVYPPYVSGTCYIVSIQAATDIYHVSLYTKLFWLEDIYITGICAEKAKIKLVHEGEISFMTREASGCAFEHAITGHKVSSTDMYKIYRELRDPNLKCNNDINRG